jgi:hypothetical protein
MKTIKRTARVMHPASGNRVFETEAMTFGELRQELETQGLDAGGYDIREGRTSTLLDRDEQLLPSHFVFQGKVTNDLMIIYLSKKPIKSGAGVELSNRMKLIEAIENLAKANGANASDYIASSYRKANEQSLKRYLEELKRAILEGRSPVVTAKEDVPVKTARLARQELLEKIARILEDEEDLLGVVIPVNYKSVSEQALAGYVNKLTAAIVKKNSEIEEEEDGPVPVQEEDSRECPESAQIKELVEKINKLNASIEHLYDAMNILIEMRGGELSDEEMEQLRQNLL